MPRALLDSILVAAVMLALALPGIDMLTGIVDDPEIDENRNLAAFPDLAARKSSITAFPSGFEDWFSDHMGLRGTLVGAYRRVNQDLLDSDDSVLGGTDGWLYLLRDTVDYADRLPLPADLCGRNPFTENELDEWIEALADNRRAVEGLGARYVLMVVPNKQSVHGEHLPGRVRCERGERRLDQLASRLEALPGFPLLDLDRVFRERAESGVQLWHKTDTHWDSTGAMLGARALVSHVERILGRALPDPFELGRLAIKPLESSGWGLARMLGPVSRHREQATILDVVDTRAESAGNALPAFDRGAARQSERFVNDDEDLPTALALHDSFFDKRFKTMLAESFSRVDFVWHRGEPLLERELELVRELRPDVVIHEMVERNLLHPYFKDR